MTKILFLIHDLGHGGAERVLVNLVNNMDTSRFDVTLLALFGGGVNEKLLSPHVKYRYVYKRAMRGNSHLMKLLSPEALHKKYIKDRYDVEIAYLEGPAVRIISGCPDKSTRLAYWVHCTMHDERELSGSFRSLREAVACYTRHDSGAFVSRGVMEAFERLCPVKHGRIIYNTNDTGRILEGALEPLAAGEMDSDDLRLIGIGKLESVKGFDRLARIHTRLRAEGYPVHTYVLGEGSCRGDIEAHVSVCGETESFTLLGYRDNPYKYLRAADLFVCSSRSEGFSTAVTESLIVGTPVCTTDVSGMRELLGDGGEWGVITDNDEDALYRGIRSLLDDREMLAHYRTAASVRGADFNTKSTVKAAQDYIASLVTE